MATWKLRPKKRGPVVWPIRGRLPNSVEVDKPTRARLVSGTECEVYGISRSGLVSEIITFDPAAVADLDIRTVDEDGARMSKRRFLAHACQ